MYPQSTPASLCWLTNRPSPFICVMTLHMLHVIQPLPGQSNSTVTRNISLLLFTQRQIKTCFLCFFVLKIRCLERYVKATAAQLQSLLYKQSPISEEKDLHVPNQLQRRAGRRDDNQSTRGQGSGCAPAWLVVVFGCARHRYACHKNNTLVRMRGHIASTWSKQSW